MKMILKISLALIILTLSFSITSNFALAKYKCGESGTGLYDTITDCVSTGCPTTNCLSASDTNAQGTVTLDNPLGKGKTDVPTLLGTVVNYVMGIIGSLALVMFIYGGATWMLSGGNQEMVTRGKQTLIWAAIGIVIIFTAYALVRFVIQTITAT